MVKVVEQKVSERRRMVVMIDTADSQRLYKAGEVWRIDPAVHACGQHFREFDPVNDASKLPEKGEA